MDEDQRQDNTISIKTHDLIITKINELKQEHKKDLKTAEDFWDLRHKALLDMIASQDKANQLHFDFLNKNKEIQIDLLNRCATKEEVKLAIVERSNELELKLKDKEAALKESLLSESTILKSSITDTRSQLATAMLLIKIIISGFLLTIFGAMIIEYARLRGP